MEIILNMTQGYPGGNEFNLLLLSTVTLLLLFFFQTRFKRGKILIKLAFRIFRAIFSRGISKFWKPNFFEKNFHHHIP